MYMYGHRYNMKGQSQYGQIGRSAVWESKNNVRGKLKGSLDILAWSLWFFSQCWDCLPLASIPSPITLNRRSTLLFNRETSTILNPQLIQRQKKRMIWFAPGEGKKMLPDPDLFAFLPIKAELLFKWLLVLWSYSVNQVLSSVTAKKQNSLCWCQYSTWRIPIGCYGLMHLRIIP